MKVKEKYLNGLHLSNMRLIKRGNTISIGVRGIASSTSFSFGTPDSISLRKLIDSVANAIFKFKSNLFTKSPLIEKSKIIMIPLLSIGSTLVFE
jgi:hypothetical protein